MLKALLEKYYCLKLPMFLCRAVDDDKRPQQPMVSDVLLFITTHNFNTYLLFVPRNVKNLLI